MELIIFVNLKIVVKWNEKIEKTRHVKNEDKS